MAILRYGVSVRSAAATAVQAKRKALYGPTGLKPETLAQRSAFMRAYNARRGSLNYHKLKRTCEEGHPFAGANLFLVRYKKRNGEWSLTRRCRICQNGRAAQRRTPVPPHQAEYLALRTRMIQAHPDKGGTSAKFIAAKRRYDAFCRERAG